MKDIFCENGYLSRIHDNFEFRSEQLKMAEFIMERLYDQESALIEAGTGIGKTLAYIIPAIIYSIENEKIIAISTETKALQKQLIDKDIPIAQAILKQFYNIEFKYSLCLGSSNYPCRKRFEVFILKGNYEPGDEDTIEYLKNIFKSKKIFTRFDLSIPNKIWNEILRDSETCNSYRCIFSSSCVYQRAKKEWMSSNLLIMNHYLFFSNISSDKLYLPKFDIVIFDEAHSIEDIASDQLGFSESYLKIKEVLDSLYKKTRKASILMKISDDKSRETAIDLVAKISKELNIFFEKLRDLFKENQYSVRIREPVKAGDILLKYLKDMLYILEKAEDEFKDDIINIDFEIARSRLFLFRQNLESFIYMQNSNLVYWMERNEEEMLGEIFLMGKPIDISVPMYKEVNSFYESTIFLSATLTARKEFSFIADRLGIYDYKPLLLNSPFDYRKQVALFLHRENSNPDDIEYINQVVYIANSIIEVTGGNSLVLFTSYRMMEHAKKRLSDLTERAIYSQADYPAAETVERYINNTGSILMGTHSFWQGIDLPGDLLKSVIMMRLPFNVPDRPLVQARIERLVERGLNPFSSYQVPSAIIKFKQGFGRLIRSKQDRGVVAVLDARILSKGYGKLFLDSLPECSTVYTLEELEKALSITVS